MLLRDHLIDCKLKSAHHLIHFINLCHHKDGFGMEAEWNFFATSHGRTAGDGAAGTLKQECLSYARLGITNSTIIKPLV